MALQLLCVFARSDGIVCERRVGRALGTRALRLYQALVKSSLSKCEWDSLSDASHRNLSLTHTHHTNLHGLKCGNTLLCFTHHICKEQQLSTKRSVSVCYITGLRVIIQANIYHKASKCILFYSIQFYSALLYRKTRTSCQMWKLSQWESNI